VINTWVELTTQFTLVNSFTKSSGFTPGVTYQFRVRAKNSIDYGTYSSTISLTPMSVPSKMAAPTTEISNVYVKITWVNSNLNGGSLVSHRVYVMKKDGTYNLENTFCSESDSGVTSQKYCMIEMSHLTGTTYNLERGDLVVAKVQI